MSVHLTNTDEIESTTDNTTEQTAMFPENSATLCRWLDEQPGFVTVKVTRRVRSTDSGTVVRYGYRDKTMKEQIHLDPDYEVTGKACYDSQADVMDAWENKQFPQHRIETVQGVEGAYLYSWSSSGTHPMSMPFWRRHRNDDNDEPVINFSAVQHQDGHGVVEHYSTIAAIRTRSGLVLANEQDYGGGMARITRPDDYEALLPLTGIESVLRGHPETLYDIDEIVVDAISIRPDREYDSDEGEWRTTGFSPQRRIEQDRILRLNTGAAVVMLIDSTANNPNERKCGFYLPPEEAPLYDRVSDAVDSLQPVAVQQALNADQFTLTPADEFAGDGATFYTESLLGDTIIRQGEWYLVPMPAGFQPDAPVYKPLPVATRDSSWDFSTVDTLDFVGVDSFVAEFPEGCPECDATSFEVEARDPEARCTECDESFLFGQYEPEDFVDEELYQQYRDALDELDSHQPRDIAVVDGDVFVRGTFRHLDNEHQMVNHRDRWHLALENTRDVTVFDLNLDLGSGVARFE